MQGLCPGLASSGFQLVCIQPLGQALDWCQPLPPHRSGQSQGPGQPRSSQLRTIGTLSWKVACVCMCVCMCAHTGNKAWWGWRLHRTEPGDPHPDCLLTPAPFCSCHHECAGTRPPPHPCTGEEIRLLLPCVCSGDAGRIRVPWGPHSHSPGDGTDGSRFQGMMVP